MINENRKCDEACAAEYNCRVGGVQCERCGQFVCADELDNCGRCEMCTLGGISIEYLDGDNVGSFDNAIKLIEDGELENS